MLILPAIDLKNGKCVRLLKGDFNTAETVSDSALITAEDFFAAGAEFIHMVDLDGALDGKGKNRDTVLEVCKAMRGRLKVELGGGIRSIGDVERAFETGVFRVIIGSAAVKKTNFVKEAARKYPARVAVGIDALEGTIRVSGWTVNTGVNAVDFAKKIEALGVRTIIYTDIDTDGTLAGPSIENLKRLRAAVKCELIASGGVGRIEDIQAIKETGVDGVIIGKALYSGNVNLKDAIEMAK